tara:strand:+ start:479 stop:763 length:285 start_codon:yes stop_codon:yes gene_type:complete
MRKHAIAALAGVAIILSLDLSTGSPAVAADEQIQQCIRHVAELERTVARQTKGDERREILRVLSQAKVACAKGNIAAAYQAAGKGLEMVKKAGS